MDKQAELIEEDGYVAVKWSEYKELLVIKGKYEELSRQEDKPLIQYIPGIQPLTTLYPQDLTSKYQTEITCSDTAKFREFGRNINGVSS